MDEKVLILFDLFLLRTKQVQVSNLADKMTENLEPIVNEVRRLIQFTNRRFIATVLRSHNPFRRYARSLEEIARFQPGNNLLISNIRGVVYHEHIALKPLLIETPQGIQDSRYWRDYVVVTGVEKLGCRSESDMINDHVSEVNTKTFFHFYLLSLLSFRCLLSIKHTTILYGESK